MPLYEYRCAACARVYEVLHLGRERPEEIFCPSCGSREQSRLFSAAAVQSHTTAARPRCGDGECCGGGQCGAGADSWK